VTIEQDRKEVFAWFGAASYYAQCVEVELWIVRLFAFRKGNPWPDDAQWRTIESEPLTMGKLLARVADDVGITQEERKVLLDCVKQRNWLSHNYWEHRSHLLASPDDCRRAIDELCDLCDLFKSGDKIACDVSTRVRRELGISEELVQHLADEYVRRLADGYRSETILDDLEARLRRLPTDVQTRKAR